MKTCAPTNGGSAAITPQQSEAATSDAKHGWDAGAVATALRCRVRSIPRGARTFFLAAFTLLLVIPSAVLAALPNAWHIPDNAIVTGDGGTMPTMRAPRVEFGNTGTVRIFSGLQKWNNGFGTADQNGGTIYYKSADQGTWSSVALSWHANTGNDQYWYADLNLANVTANQVIQYYIGITFNSGAENAFIYGGGDQGGYQITTNNAAAAAAPFTVRNRPAWVFHSNNRVVNGNSVQFWSKLGYISDPNTPSTKWADSGAVYYTTDGSDPTGELGVGNGTTQVALCTYDHPESNNQGSQSPAGTPMWWVATAPTLLQNVPVGGTIKYKIGFWHAANNEEKFADYQAGTPGQVFTFTNGTVGDPVLTVNGVNANYTTTHFFVDEVAGDSRPVTVTFAPGQGNVTQVEVFTNLNRRDRAQLDADGDGIEDGIKPPDGNNATVGDNNYFTAFTMTNAGAGSYTLTLNATKTGAYRLTARWKVEGDSSWRWFTNLAANRRDHAFVVSPVDSRNVNLYEVNVLTIESSDNTPGNSGDDFANRSTFEDLFDAPNAPHNADNRWNLDYVKNLGCNWLWFQPIHPIGVDGQAYYPGSPYAVKNFFEINPLMSVGNSRDSAMGAFQGFVSAADIKGVKVMLDAPFNHTAPDAEISTVGVPLFGGNATDEIRNKEARFYSQSGNYGARASNKDNIAIAPDRGDFGKWSDVRDVFFGNYSALVSLNPQDNGNYNSEGDFFDFKNPNFDGVTQKVWKYFAEYPLYWLEKTGVPAGSDMPTQTNKGIDGLRADFGQGLPPQLWEYIINKTRARKWNFVFMSESLDGGAVTYRSNRHFDILNENIVFPLASASNASDYRSIFEGRRSAYGQGLVLLNSTSHDEENYTDPFEALVRYAVVNTVDGAPLVFPGQELGISRTFGYQSYETNFGKQIAHFKLFNSMMPIWLDANYGNDQLYPVYSGIGQARIFSAALRSSNRWFLDGDGYNSKLFAVAKYEQDGASPAVKDVVLAFANIDRNNDETNNFKIPDALATKLGIKGNRTYNVKNIAAYLGVYGDRRSTWLWTPPNGSNGYTGDQLKNSGFTVITKKVPTSDAAWATAPYEAQYLKVYDVTQLPAPSSSPAVAAYALDGSVTFTWAAVVDPEGLVPRYKLTVTRSDGPVNDYETFGTTYTVGGLPTGVTATATVTTLNPNNTSIASAAPSTTSNATLSIASAADNDGDGMRNAAEVAAGTNPLDPASVFKITSIAPASGSGLTITWSTVAGKTYYVEAASNLAGGTWTTISPAITGTGTYTDTNPVTGKKFYRIKVGP
ncbi:MAG: alpha-amylase family glycosyl hydrolase [Verrucomicrobiota bacterium]